MVNTEVGRIVNETLDQALEAGRLVAIDGDARIGKTFAVQAWCDIHAHEARYVQTPCDQKEQSFLSAIARAIGMPVPASANWGNLRARIEMFLRDTRIMLVFDEGHWLLSAGRYTVPQRLAWILTAVTNRRCACGIVITPQFLKAQEQIASRTNWNLTQFTGRLMTYAQLPKKLDVEDLAAVVKHLFPGLSDRIQRAIVGYAAKSQSFMEGIAFTKEHAERAARKAGRSQIIDVDIQDALKRLNASSNAIAERLQPGRQTLNQPAEIAPTPEFRPEHRNEFPQVGRRQTQPVCDLVNATSE